MSAADKKRIADLEFMLAKYQDELVPKLNARIEELIAVADDWKRIFDMLNDRENRHHYLEWWRKHYNYDDLTYPDGDQIYKDFWSVMADLQTVCLNPDADRDEILTKWGFNSE